MNYIYFIINPVSGKGRHGLTEACIRSFFPETRFRIEVHFTKHKGHARDLSMSAVALNASVVVACGGDGTINEVASCLVGTGIKLGIIPLGSGNGLSAHLKIPKDIADALHVICAGYHVSIDIGKVNEYYFFSNMGTGIDAMIINLYEKSGKRNLNSYIKATLRAKSKYKPRMALIDIDDEIIEVSPLLLFISNSNEMGYGMSLTPKASLSDGLLDLVIVKGGSLWHQLQLGFLILKDQVEKFRHARHILVNKLFIEIPDNIFTDIQIDGEYHNLKTNMLSVSVLEKEIDVIVPHTS